MKPVFLILAAVLVLCTAPAVAQFRLENSAPIQQNSTQTTPAYEFAADIDSVLSTFTFRDTANVRIRAVPVSRVGTTEVTGDTVLVDVLAVTAATVYTIPYHRLRDAFTGKAMPYRFKFVLWFDPDATATLKATALWSTWLREFK